jgi:hypothetical protein
LPLLTLTDLARTALQAEIQRRGMSNAQLEKLHSKELHREARFDQFESVRRRKTLLYLLTKNDPKGVDRPVRVVALLVPLRLGLKNPAAAHNFIAIVKDG